MEDGRGGILPHADRRTASGGGLGLQSFVDLVRFESWAWLMRN
jgi:hypothetical protein